ncbi:hypothetical protein D9758_008298 [Tetrapyrgos nigripes]|uniref:Flavin reductase like domain-containing protein n=1 Tax=Tetrapyrgos nigripes TaxID=182062 RepID=A0A8H5LFL5_9AGAR|nr:hypothetical protein D9758_008298 [Tetrapyrgos nigripes]
MLVEETEEGRKWVEGEKQGWKRIDTEGEDWIGIQPRPIAFVSSVSENGVDNLAPFSFFNAVGPFPPLVSYSAMNLTWETDGTSKFKDSVENVKASSKRTSSAIGTAACATKEFTVNMISIPWAEQANFASIDTPHDVSEWELTGLTKMESTHVKAPRVKESAFSMECELFHTYDIIHPKTKQHTGTVVYGLVKCIHVRNDVLVDSKELETSGHKAKIVVDPAKIRTIARMGDITYGYVREPFRLPESSWEKDGEVIKKVVDKYKKEKGLGN